jgi:hypothetical protein
MTQATIGVERPPAAPAPRLRFQHARGHAPVVVTTRPQRRDLLVLALRTALGLALLLVGWFEASGSLTVSAQTPWLVCAAAGTAVAAGAQALWVLRLRRAVVLRITAVHARAGELGPGALRAATGDPVCVAGVPARLYHRADCDLVAGRAATAATVSEHRLARRAPCEVCVP